MFPRIAFSIDLAARATGLSEARIRRWVRDGAFTSSYVGIGDPRHSSRTFSYKDVVVLRTLAALRDEGIRLHRPGEIGKRLKALPDDDWDRSTLVVREDGALVVDDQPPARNGISHENGAREAITLPLSRVVNDVAEKVREIEERTPEEIGHVTRRRRVMHGQPVLAGTRIPTSTIYYFIKNRYDREWILENYPRLKDQDITAAIAFEEERLGTRAAS